VSAPWIVVAGATGTGKSELAAALAERLGCEIVNYDSIQIYRGFDIGSAKPDASLRARVPHHLYDAADPDQELNAADYARLASGVCGEIESRGRRPLLVGGTGFWLRALLAGLPEMPPRDPMLRRRLQRILSAPRGAARAHRWLARVDPAAAARIAPADRHRIERALEVWILTGRPISARTAPGGRSPRRPSILLAVRFPREALAARLDARIEAMYEAGLVEETKGLLARYGPHARPLGSIGYAEAAAVADGRMELAVAKAETRRRTRAYAKRQMTWLRGEQDVHWLDGRLPIEALLEEAFDAVRRHSLSERNSDHE
jgi:tRNA dimethylallyltransferase